MATACPCGCGVRVGFLQKGAAAGASEMSALIAEFESRSAAINTKPMSAEDREECLRMARDYLREGKRIRSDLLAHVHRTAKPHTTPDQLQLSRELASFREGVRTFPF